jgi:phage terminase large subunit
MTSASARQVKTILWKELRRILHESACMPLGGTLHEVPDAGLQLSDGREIVGFSTDKPERMAGISGANILFIVDEASGVPEQIFAAIEGNRAGGARVVMFSNPTQTSGTFYEAFHEKKQFWHTICVSSEEAAKVTPPIEGLATRAWVEEKLAEWGEGSPLLDVRVRGNFPRSGECVVVPLDQVEAGSERWEDTPEDGPLEIGVDPARYGDDTSAIFPRRGKKALEPTEKQNLDGPNLAGQVLLLVRALRRNADEKPRVKVDVNGIGASCFDHLVRSDEVEAISVNTSEASSRPELYSNLRAQVGFAVAEWLKEGGALPPNGRLHGELVAPKYKFDAQNRLLIEKKDEIKKRLKRSPNLGDALALAIYQPPPRPTHAGVQGLKALLPRTRF